MSKNGEEITSTEEIEEALQSLPRKSDQLIPALQSVQSTYGYLPERALDKISEDFNVPLAEVTGVATFYSQFFLEPQGDYTIRVCKGTACHVKGADEILGGFIDELGIAPGEVTEDGTFTLTTVRCLGCCSLAPVAMIGEETYGNLDKDKIKRIVGDYR